MMRKPYWPILLAVPCALALAAVFTAAGPAEEKPQVKIILATPQDSQWVISDDKGHLDVIVENISDHPVKLYDDWSSWGWFNISLEWSMAGGEKGKVVHADRAWEKNFPAVTEIPPGGAIVRRVDLEKSWTGWPAFLDHKKLTLRAVYDSKGPGPGYAGSAASDAITVSVEDNRPRD